MLGMPGVCSRGMLGVILDRNHRLDILSSEKEMALGDGVMDEFLPQNGG